MKLLKIWLIIAMSVIPLSLYPMKTRFNAYSAALIAVNGIIYGAYEVVQNQSRENVDNNAVQKKYPHAVQFIQIHLRRGGIDNPEQVTINTMKDSIFVQSDYTTHMGYLHRLCGANARFL